MTSERMTDRVSALRQAFDRAFAEAPLPATERFEDLLAIRVFGHPYAVRLTELSGLFAGRPVTPLPTGVSGLLGLAGLRGALVPVYDLRILFGYPGTDVPRWLVLVGQESAVGLGFDGFDGYLRLPLDAVTRRTGDEATALACELVRTPDAVRSLVHVPAVLNAIRERTRHGVPPQER